MNRRSLLAALAGAAAAPGAWLATGTARAQGAVDLQRYRVRPENLTWDKPDYAKVALLPAALLAPAPLVA